MPQPILTTKLFIPPPRPQVVARPRLFEQLNEGIHHKLTLVCAPAGFGKTTLVSEWLAHTPRSAVWLSLDEGDNDLHRFFTYVIVALQKIAPAVGETLLPALQNPQPPAADFIVTTLLNDLATLPQPMWLVLDDYHLLDNPAIHQALTTLCDYLPPQLHLLLATREDPPLPLAKFRAKGQLTELRIAHLRFTPAEAAAFLNQVMGLHLTPAQVTTLDQRTEGWIVGLQLAALSLKGQPDAHTFINAFTGNHHFVLDYLLEEVLHQQPADLQTFLLVTALLPRMCGALCEVVLGTAAGTEMLTTIEQANLFIIPLDQERRWYRYHHLFSELLRQRLQQQATPAEIATYHLRASHWFEENGLELEAFYHATAAPDISRAEYLINGRGMPLQLRGGATPILNWLATLPPAVLDEKPSLWVTYASALLVIGQVVGVEEKARAAELALAQQEPTPITQDLIGRIASIRATVAVTQHQADEIIVQANRALTYLHPQNISVRASITWTLGYAYELQGQRQPARQVYQEAAQVCLAIGHATIAKMSLMGWAHMQQLDNQLHLAAETYQKALDMAGDVPNPPLCDAYLGLAQIAYEWNELETAEQHLLHSLPLAQQIANTDRYTNCRLFFVRLKLAQGNLTGAQTLLNQVAQEIHQHQFKQIWPELVAVQVQLLLQQGHLPAAAQLVQNHPFPLELARVQLAQGEPAQALVTLSHYADELRQKGWVYEQLQVWVLQALAHQAAGEKDQALHQLQQALTQAEPAGFRRLFVDEGRPMAVLLTAAAQQGVSPTYVNTLRQLFPTGATPAGGNQTLVEPLSDRELEILRLIAEGCSNQEISQRLFLALSTVKGHNQRIFGKLQAQSRTEAIALGRELGLLE